MIKLTLLESSRTRVAFEGVSAFYRALEGRSNPFFYVSSSPWNLHQFLIEFMELHCIPTGAMYLRDFGLDETKLIAGAHKTHKLDAIERILNFTGSLKFILAGDSGQRDPEVYAEVVRRHPKRILAIYIRDVSDVARDGEVQLLIEEVNSFGIDMLLVPDTRAAARHAAEQGYIDEGSYERVGCK
jgi:phosphatidate phosphatase APP1